MVGTCISRNGFFATMELCLQLAKVPVLLKSIDRKDFDVRKTRKNAQARLQTKCELETLRSKVKVTLPANFVVAWELSI